jgi:membrane-associated phospholipid phosphatase
LDLALVAYALLASLLLLVGLLRGVPGCGMQLLANAAVLAVALGITRWSRDTTAWLPTLLRFCYVPIFYLVFYRQIEIIWPILRAASLDAGLARLEWRLFHSQPSLAFRAAYPYPWLSELFCFAYFAYYFFTPVVFLTILVRRGYLAAERIALATSLCFFGCYTIFWLFPTVGPHYFFPPHLGPQLYDGYLFNHLLFLLTSSGEIRAGAFPSSHIAVALLMTLLARRGAPVLFLPLALITALMLPAVVYLRAHYLLDVPAGILTGLVVFMLSNKLLPRSARSD